MQKPNLDQNDLELTGLLVLKVKERKIEWAFSGNNALGFIAGANGAAILTFTITYPKPDLLQNDKWRQFTVVAKGSQVMAVSNPNEIIARNSDVRTASYEVAEAVDKLSAEALSAFRDKTYGSAISLLKGI